MSSSPVLLACTECSNGCLLTVESSGDGTQIVSGNTCQRGLGFASKTLRDSLPGNFISKEVVSSFNSNQLRDVVGLWGKNLDRSFPGKFIQGSPERSRYRTVIADTQGARYILEQIDRRSAERKERVGEVVAHLAKAGLPVVGYCPVGAGGFVGRHEGDCWMLSPFVEGRPLDRATYWREGWRGQAVARFLVDLNANSGNLLHGEKPFSLPSYIDQLVNTLQLRNKEVHHAIGPVVDYLKDNLYPVYKSVPVGFSHGDPHPLNMIWNEGSLAAVIDWEFCGIKPVLYDTALIVGCVGSESPEALKSEFLTQFLSSIEEELAGTDNLEQQLPLFVVAQRFAWLSEWLRRKDSEMIQFEIEYQHFLLENFKFPCR